MVLTDAYGVVAAVTHIPSTEQTQPSPVGEGFRNFCACRCFLGVGQLLLALLQRKG